MARNVKAPFIVEATGPDTFVITYKAAFGTGATQAYRDGLRLVLKRLCERKAVLRDAQLASTTVEGWAAKDKRLTLEDERKWEDQKRYAYPIILHREVDRVDDLRAALMTANQRTGRAPGAKGRGNPSKRIKLFVTVAGFHKDPAALAVYLATGSK